MNTSEVTDYATRKLRLLEEISVNTKKQARFIRRGELRGLRRLLSEREALLAELCSLKQSGVGDQNQGYAPGLQKLFAQIAALEPQILDACGRAMQEALAALERIGAQLREVRVGRHLQYQYVKKWTVPLQGISFNKKG